MSMRKLSHLTLKSAINWMSVILWCCLRGQLWSPFTTTLSGCKQQHSQAGETHSELLHISLSNKREWKFTCNPRLKRTCSIWQVWSKTDMIHHKCNSWDHMTRDMYYYRISPHDSQAALRNTAEKSYAKEMQTYCDLQQFRCSPSSKADYWMYKW